MSSTIFIDGGPPKGLPVAGSVSLTDGIVVAQGGTPGVAGSAIVREATTAQVLAPATAALATETARATAAESLLAPKANAAFTGIPTVPTAAAGTNTTQAASTAFVATSFATLLGTATNNNAPAGQVGEYLTGAAGGGALANGIAANATSVSLTAGDWDVHGRTVFVASGGAAPTALETGINTVSATFLATGDGGGAQLLAATFNANTTNAVSTTTTRISLAVTTTVFLVALAMFPGGAVNATGFIGARRAR